MKKVLLFVAAAGLLATMPSCKKGENDPGLSLKSRKARLAGEYTISEWESSTTVTEADGDVMENMTKITGAAGTETITDKEVGESPVALTKNITVQKGEYSFTKDGTWERTINTTAKWTEKGDGVVIDKIDHTVVTTLTESGTWSFLGGQPADFKNKERVALDVLKTNSTSERTRVAKLVVGGTSTETTGVLTTNNTNAPGDRTEVIELDMLKNKEMTFKMDLSNSKKDKNADGVETGSTTVGSATVKLTQK